MNVDVRVERPWHVDEVRQLVAYHLQDFDDTVRHLRIDVRPSRDPTGLAECRVSVTLKNDIVHEIQEAQPRLDLAVSRALDRSARTHRRSSTGWRRYSAL